MTEETKNLLIRVGRELADVQLTGAVETAESNEQLTNQIFVLRRAALFILATEAFNHYAQFQRPVASFLDLTIDDLVNEIEYLKDGVMVKTPIGGAD